MDEDGDGRVTGNRVPIGFATRQLPVGALGSEGDV
jgi:hypothetical protein